MFRAHVKDKDSQLPESFVDQKIRDHATNLDQRYRGVHLVALETYAVTVAGSFLASDHESIVFVMVS